MVKAHMVLQWIYKTSSITKKTWVLRLRPITMIEHIDCILVGKMSLPRTASPNPQKQLTKKPIKWRLITERENISENGQENLWRKALWKLNVNNYKLTKKRVQDSQTINVRKEADQNVRSQWSKTQHQGRIPLTFIRKDFRDPSRNAYPKEENK